jgi:hypothetical protein
MLSNGSLCLASFKELNSDPIQLPSLCLFVFHGQLDCVIPYYQLDNSSLPILLASTVSLSSLTQQLFANHTANVLRSLHANLLVHEICTSYTLISVLDHLSSYPSPLTKAGRTWRTIT